MFTAVTTGVMVNVHCLHKCQGRVGGCVCLGISDDGCWVTLLPSSGCLLGKL